MEVAPAQAWGASSGSRPAHLGCGGGRAWGRGTDALLQATCGPTPTEDRVPRSGALCTAAGWGGGRGPSQSSCGVGVESGQARPPLEGQEFSRLEVGSDGPTFGMWGLGDRGQRRGRYGIVARMSINHYPLTKREFRSSGAQPDGRGEGVQTRHNPRAMCSNVRARRCSENEGAQ